MNSVITYTVNRAMNTGLYISVQNGEVMVKAPWYLSREKIQATIEEKKKWITEKLREYEDQNIKNRNYIENNKVKILGKDYALKVFFKNVELPELDLEENKVVIYIPNKYKKIEHQDIVRKVIEKMYDTLAEKEIENMMEKTRIALGIAPEDYKIERMDKTLAKITQDKTIIINPDIIMQNKEILEYVVLHEFCHLKYKNHVKGFYEMIKKQMPYYKIYEEEIKEYKY